MQKWEYMLIRISQNRISWINFEEVPVNKRKNAIEYINQLGDEGWEVTGMAGDILISLILKRPKQGE